MRELLPEVERTDWQAFRRECDLDWRADEQTPEKEASYRNLPARGRWGIVGLSIPKNSGGIPG